MGIRDTTATFYDDVRVPVTNRVGDENGGWSLITSQLNHERVAICTAGMIGATSTRSPGSPRSTTTPTVGAS